MAITFRRITSDASFLLSLGPVLFPTISFHLRPRIAPLSLAIQGDDGAIDVIDQSEDMRELCIGLLLAASLWARMTAAEKGWSTEELVRSFQFEAALIAVD